MIHGNVPFLLTSLTKVSNRCDPDDLGQAHFPIEVVIRSDARPRTVTSDARPRSVLRRTIPSAVTSTLLPYLGQIGRALLSAFHKI